MGSAALIILLLALLALLLGGGLLALQIWLAGRAKVLWGFAQPAVWGVLVLWNNLASHTGAPNPGLENGLYGVGAVVMAVLTLLVFLFARWRIHKS